jgi:hypothetical protein
MNPVVFLCHLEHLMRGVIGGPATEALGQSGRG